MILIIVVIIIKYGNYLCFNSITNRVLNVQISARKKKKNSANSSSIYLGNLNQHKKKKKKKKKMEK